MQLFFMLLLMALAVWAMYQTQYLVKVIIAIVKEELRWHNRKKLL